MKEHIILFGAGAYANKIILKVEKYFYVDAICDNKSSLWGDLFRGKHRIISMAELVDKHKNTLVLVAIDSKASYDVVSNQLNVCGITYKHVNEGLYDVCMKNNDYFYVDEDNLDLIDNLYSDKRNIYVLTAPAHSNLGDQAQSYCIEMLLREKYGDSNIYIYDENQLKKNYYELLYIIKQSLKEGDWILLHSGYRLTNLYMTSEYIVEMMGELFNNWKMIFLPQTVYYTEPEIESKISKKINSNVTIMCRDIVSYENALRIFPSSKAVLFPDLVTTLIGRYQFEHERKGILLVLRGTGDGESLLSESDIDVLENNLRQIAHVSQTDTTIVEDWEKISKNRKFYIEKEIEEYSNYQLIITNRYHGTIFSLAANTPVIVLPTKDHKITAGLKWFDEAGYSGIYFCEELSSVFEIAKNVIQNQELIDNADYFYQRFYKDFDLEKL